MNAASEAIFRPVNRLLKMAIVGGVESAVKLHVERGDDLNARDDCGFTPLMLAASRNRAGICRILIEARVDTSAKDGSGNDALAIALAAGAVEAAAEIEAAMSGGAPELAAAQEPDGQSRMTSSGGDAAQAAIVGSERPPLSEQQIENEVSPRRESEGSEECAPDADSLADATANALRVDAPAFAVDEDGPPVDLSGWDAEEVSPAPEDDASLADAPTALHRVISVHEPIDDSADWSDFEAFLPEHAAPLPRADNEEARAELRVLLLRALREGSVPSTAVDDLDGVSVETMADTPMSPLRFVIEDLGAETDERFEYRAPHESFEVYTEPAETADEERVVDEALSFLDDLESRQNDPMRLYMREAQRRSLIGAADEVDLAKTMENAARQAVDALVEWPTGIARVFEAVETARAGTRSVSSIVASQHDEADTVPATTDEGVDASLTTEADATSAPDGLAEVCDANESVDASLFDKATNLRALMEEAVAGAAVRGQIATALHALSLSRTFLLQLAESALGDPAEAAMRLLAATRRIEAARDKMAGANLRLVLSIAKRYLFSGIPMDDLIQEGNIGLLKAVDKFDWRRGFKFSTMATWWIRQQISRSVADSALAIRLPAHFRDEVLLIERATKDIERSQGRMPSMEQLAAHLDMKASKVAMLLRTVSTPLSIDELEAEFESAEAFASDPFDALDAIQLGGALAGSLDALDSRSAKVIRLRYGIGVAEPCTLEEVGQLFELTRERIRQIEAKAMKRLMHPTRLDKLRPWIDKDPQKEKAEQASDPSVPDTRGEEKPGANLVAEPAEGEAPEHAEVVDRDDPAALERLLARASELGIAVEHTGGGISRATWVNIDLARDKQTRGLIRRLVAMGFMHWPGKGYWK